MKVSFTNLSNSNLEFIGCADELLETLCYPFNLEIVLSHMEENHLESLIYTDDDDNEYLIEKELELIYE